MLAAGCELADVSAPLGADLLVVESLLRVGASQQLVLLHRSLGERVVRGEPEADVSISSAAGRIPFVAAPLEQCLAASPRNEPPPDLRIEASCYASVPDAGRFVRPGETYELEIRTADGSLVRGRTTVPGAFALNLPGAAVDPETLRATCRLPADPFTLTWSAAEGAWAYLVSLHLSNWAAELLERGVAAPDPIELTGVSVSQADTTLLFPADLGLFQRADLDQRIFLALREGIPSGAEARLVVAAGDRNFVNSVRGGRFNPSGNVRSSSVVGDGVGVFGSLVPLLIRSPGSAGSLAPPCAS